MSSLVLHKGKVIGSNRQTKRYNCAIYGGISGEGRLLKVKDQRQSIWLTKKQAAQDIKIDKKQAKKWGYTNLRVVCKRKKK